MKSSFLKTSTAMMMALSLLQPGPIWAQNEALLGGACADTGEAPPCGAGIDLILPDGTVIPSAELPEELVLPAEEAPVEEPVAEEPAVEEPVAEEPPAEEPLAEEPAAEEPAVEEPAAEEPVAEEPAVEEPAAEEPAAEEPPAEEPAAEEPVAEEPVAEEPPAEKPLAEEPAAEEPAAEEPVAEEPVAEEPVVEEAAAEEPAAEEPVAEEPQPEEPAAEEPAVEEPAAEEPAAEEPAAEAPAAEETSDAPVGDAEPGVAIVVPGAEELRDEAQAVFDTLGAAEEAEAGETEAPEAAILEADPETVSEEATEVIETLVTEEDTRQSDEDFATTASGAPRAGAEDDGGLSNLEKAALVGLGILAVGAILNNGDEVVANTGDRVVMRSGEDEYYVLKDDDALLRQPGSTLRTETFRDGSTRTIVTRDDGTRIVTIRDASGRVLRRVREDADGRQYTLIDDLSDYEPVIVERLPEPRREEVALDETDPLAIRIALERAAAADVGRAFSLRQIRGIEEVRKLVPEISAGRITFATGSAAIDPSEARDLVRLGDLMVALIEDDPSEMFLIEGHTDAVGSAASNLALSDRRAESLALALTEYFGVPPENMIVQGYGESDLKVDTLEDEELNRRVAVRRITPLLDLRTAAN